MQGFSPTECWDCHNVLSYLLIYLVLLGLPLGMIFTGRVLDRLERAPRLAVALRVAGGILLVIAGALVLVNLVWGL